jgi:hypothetical protein
VVNWTSISNLAPGTYAVKVNFTDLVDNALAGNTACADGTPATQAYCFSFTQR